MNAWFAFRFLLARLTFLLLRLPVGRFEKEVQEIWSLPRYERESRLNEYLKSILPRGSTGQTVSSLAEVACQKPLTKETFRNTGVGSGNANAGFNRHTAGTTGDPTHIVLSKEELARMLAVRAYCYRNHGFRLGQREGRLWGRSPKTFIARVRDFLLNRKVFYPAESDVCSTVASLLSWKPEYIYGYTSLILEAARVVKSRGMQPDNLKAVVCTAESILPSQKKFISDAFGAPVIEEYGSTEFDVIAFECRDGHLHLVNPWLLVETENDSVLITDVTRKSQSLVRYSLGDSLRIRDSRCRLLGDTQAVDELRGRTAQQFAYLPSGKKFHAVVFGRALDAYMHKFRECLKFTVVQTDIGDILLYLDQVPAGGLEHVKNWLNLELRVQLNVGHDLIKAVHAGDGQMKKGKHTYFIQNMDTENHGR